jgi:hypothetical protein
MGSEDLDNPQFDDTLSDIDRDRRASNCSSPARHFTATNRTRKWNVQATAGEGQGRAQGAMSGCTRIVPGARRPAAPVQWAVLTVA